jgi:hypothetical protein
LTIEKPVARMFLFLKHFKFQPIIFITAPPDLYQTAFPWYHPSTEVEAEEKSGELIVKPCK